MHIGSLRRKEILQQVSTELLDSLGRRLEVRSTNTASFFVFSQVIIVFGRIVVCFMFNCSWSRFTGCANSRSSVRLAAGQDHGHHLLV
jgi:hypothetical protein